MLSLPTRGRSGGDSKRAAERAFPSLKRQIGAPRPTCADAVPVRTVRVCRQAHDAPVPLGAWSARPLGLLLVRPDALRLPGAVCGCQGRRPPLLSPTARKREEHSHYFVFARHPGRGGLRARAGAAPPTRAGSVGRGPAQSARRPWGVSPAPARPAPAPALPWPISRVLPTLESPMTAEPGTGRLPDRALRRRRLVLPRFRDSGTDLMPSVRRH